MASRAEHRSRILLLAARTVTSILQALGYQCAVCGPVAVHALEAIPLEAPSGWTVTIFVRTQAKTETIRNAIAKRDGAHFSGSSGLVYHCPEPQLIIAEGKGTCQIEIITSLVDFTFRRAFLVSSLPLAPLPYLLYELLTKWRERHGSVFSTRKGKDLKIVHAIDVFTRRLLRRSDSLAELDKYGSFSLSGAKTMKELVAAFSQSSPERQRIFTQLGVFGILIPSPSLAPRPSSTTPSHSNPPSSSSQPLPARISEVIDTKTKPNAQEGPPIARVASRHRGNLKDKARTRVEQATRAAIDLLYSLGCSAAIFGGFACSLYGTTRPPKDADILVLHRIAAPQNYTDTEALKAALVSRDPAHFFSKPGRAPGATYRVLHYRSAKSGGWLIKVDILLPGILHLPALPESRIVWVAGFPVVPFPLLLLQKLQAYDDHFHAEAQHHFVQWLKDRDDIQALLELRGDIEEWPWHDKAVFSDEFLALSFRRVTDFAAKFSWSRAAWEELGFDV